MNDDLHVIVGAGQVGPLVAERLIAQGKRVRMIRRGKSDDPRVEIMSANVADPRAAAEAMRGARVVYHCANPLYHKWADELVPLAAGIVAGAAEVGARLVALDNLYMYELPADGRLAPDTRVAPRSKKGALRERAADLMLGAHARGEVEVAIARAADFFGAHATRSIFGDRFWQRLFAGKPVEVWGDPNTPHTYSCVSDVADGLVTLGLAERDAFGKVWHLPALPAESTRAWIERFAKAANRAARLTRLSPTMLKLVGVFVPEAKEIPEMMYQWEQPFVLDDAAFRARFGAEPTPAAVVVREAVAWAERRYLPRAA